jgi:glycosyltransferase involved in cell wall biosynthesis
MRCPRLSEIPAPPSGKEGWPWTEESRTLPSLMADGCSWPRITVVTPSYNQGQFLEETLRSVLLQGYPNLEYFVFDGASTDNSVEVIEKYEPWLSYWVSEPDAGQSAAINRGFKMGSGLYATWINSDDLLCKNALVEHASQIGFTKNTVYVGICCYIDGHGRFVSTHRGRIHSLVDLVSLRTIWYSGGNIVQPEALFPLELAREVGGLNADNHFTMDYELWGQFFLAGARFQYTDIPFGMARRHPDQKTGDGIRTARSLIDTAAKLTGLANSFSENTRRLLLADLDAFWEEYPKVDWRNSGRLARIGLPSIMVKPLRNFIARFKRIIPGHR